MSPPHTRAARRRFLDDCQVVPLPPSGRPASPPSPAHLGLDDAREQAQGDQQPHSGRPPPRAGPPGPPAHAARSPHRGRPGPCGPGNNGRPGRRPTGTDAGGRETPGSEVRASSSCECGGEPSAPTSPQEAPPLAQPRPRERGLVGVVVPRESRGRSGANRVLRCSASRARVSRRPMRPDHAGPKTRKVGAGRASSLLAIALETRPGLLCAGPWTSTAAQSKFAQYLLTLLGSSTLSRRRFLRLSHCPVAVGA